VPHTDLSCPACGARAAAHLDACAACDYRFVEGAAGRRRVPRVGLAGALAAALVVAVAVAAVALLAGGDDPDPAAAARSSPEVLSMHPLSTHAAERRLEARFASAQDDDSAAARCSELEPRPAHAIRHCRIRYPGGAERSVIVLSNPQGRELLIEP
jgi:hypothetical protein